MFFLFFIIAAGLLWLYIVLLNRRPPNYPPGPAWLPFFGNLPELKKLSIALGGQHMALTHLAKEYKTNVLGLKLGSEYVVVVYTYPLVREILTTEVYEGRPDNFFIRLRSFGTRKGVTMTDGEFWKEQRNFVVRHLRKLGFGKQLMETMVKEEVQEVLKIIESGDLDLKISTIISPAVINILWCLTAGKRIPRSDPKLTQIINLFQLRTKAFDISGGTLSQYPWLRFIAPEQSGYNLIKKLNNELRDLFMTVIKEHYADWTKDKSDDLIYAFITEMKSVADFSTFTDEQLVMICMDIFIAGSTTTSNTIDFALLMMILHPEIQLKVHAYLDDAFPDNYSLNYTDKEKVPFIEAVLLEVERYCGIVPIAGPRRALSDTVLDGYTIPKNTTLLVSMYSIHRDKEYWKDPDLFCPQRFLDEKGALFPHERVVPFGLGRRRCLGEALAKQCIFMFFVEIMRKYTICLKPGSKPPTGIPIPGITLSPENYAARFIKRK